MVVSCTNEKRGPTKRPTKQHWKHTPKPAHPQRDEKSKEHDVKGNDDGTSPSASTPTRKSESDLDGGKVPADAQRADAAVEVFTP
jgi:hypothetical protein